MITLGANLIYVTDLPRARQWYQDVFGMEEVEYRPPEFLQMKLGDATFYIETANDKRAEGFKEVHIGGRSSAVFNVDNLASFVVGAKNKGARIVVEPVEQFWGGLNAVIADPDGNEFILDQDEV